MITLEKDESIFFKYNVEENLKKALDELTKEDFYELRNGIYSIDWKTISYDPYDKKIKDDYIVGIGYPLYLDGSMTLDDFKILCIEEVESYQKRFMLYSDTDSWIDNIVDNDLPAWDVTPAQCQKLIHDLSVSYFVKDNTNYDVQLPDFTVQDDSKRIKDNAPDWDRDEMISSLSGLTALYFLKQYDLIAKVLSNNGELGFDDIEYISHYFNEFIRENYYFQAAFDIL